MGARILQFPQNGNGNGNSPGKPQQPTRGLQDALDRVASRGEFVDELLTALRGNALGFVADWYEAFAFGIKNAEYQLAEDRKVYSDRALEKMKESNEQGDKNTIKVLKKHEAAAYFFGRCAQIYAEEMHEIEELEKAARERAASRIEKEFEKDAYELARALRENDPQTWAGNHFDWN